MNVRVIIVCAIQFVFTLGAQIIYAQDEETGIQDMCRQMVGICTRIRIPVCASSGNTYDNECMLNEAICVQNRTNIEKNRKTEDNEVALFKMFDGVCPTNEIASTRDSDDCKPSPCLPTYDVVCGTDGVTYSNECAVQITACLFDEKSKLKVAFNGSCYSSERISQQGDSDFGIHVDNEREAIFVAARTKYSSFPYAITPTNIKKECAKPCTSYYLPVCGTDGKSYSNVCSLQSASCKTEKGINFSHFGYCKDSTSIQDSSKAQNNVEITNFMQLGNPKANPFGQLTFAVDSKYLPNPFPSGNPWVPSWDVFLGYSSHPFYTFPYQPYAAIHQIQGRKSCENWCSGIYRPLCANDGSLYSSKCMLDFNNCLAENRGEPLLTVDNESVIIDGKCFKKSDSNAHDDVGFEIEEVVAENEDGSDTTSLSISEQDCPSSCTFEYDPVCGSDGATYSNLCNMKVTSCILNKRITLSYIGECKKELSNSLSGGSQVQAAALEIEPIVSPDSGQCEFTFDPVCGTDGVTYSNACNLKNTADALGLSIAVSYKGRCTPC